MKIIDELISTLDCEVPVRDVQQGPFQTAVLTRNCGLASTPHDRGPHDDKSPVAKAGMLLDENVRDLALLANSPRANEAAIGMATINSLIEVNEADCVELNAADLLVQKGDNKRVAIIGHLHAIASSIDMGIASNSEVKTKIDDREIKLKGLFCHPRK